MLIAFSGFKGAGKDTAANVLINEYGFTKVAFADAVRELALIIDPIVWADPDYKGEAVRLSDVVEQFGWDFSKRSYSEVRRLLQVIGTEAGRNFFNEDIWIEILEKQFPGIAWPDTRYVITDCRFKNEVDFVKDKAGTVVWIARPGLQSDGHASESDVPRVHANHIIYNDATIEDLESNVRTLLDIRGVAKIGD